MATALIGLPLAGQLYRAARAIAPGSAREAEETFGPQSGNNGDLTAGLILLSITDPQVGMLPLTFEAFSGVGGLGCFWFLAAALVDARRGALALLLGLLLSLRR